MVLSDLYDRQGFTQALDLLLGRGHQVRLLHLVEADEGEPPWLGDVELVDVEQGSAVQGTITERVAARYRELYGAFCHSVAAYCASRGILYRQIANNSAEDELMLWALSGYETSSA